MSQDVVNFSVPVGLNWNEHSAGSAMTVTGDAASAVRSAGLAKCVMPWKMREVGHAREREARHA